MSWSQAYTGHRSIWRDSYHRVSFALDLKSILKIHPSEPEILDAIKRTVFKSDPIDLNNPGPNKLKPEDMEVGIYHVVFLVDDSFFEDSSQDQTGVYLKLLETIQEMVPRSRLSVTLIISSDEPTKLLRHGASVLLSTQPDSVVVDYRQSREHTTSIVTKVYELLTEYPSITLGIGKVPNRHIFEFILSHIPPDCQLRIYNLGEIVVPNFQIRMTNFSSSKLMNTIAFVSRQDLVDPASAYATLALKYAKPIPTTILKCMLQVGYVPCIKINSIDDFSFISQYISALAHPFVYRKPYIAPTDIIHFHVDNEDMDMVFEASEALESMDDVEWMERVHAKPVVRERKF